MAKITADRFFHKSGGWFNLYIVGVALSMSMLGLVMLFSAGAVKGAQSLLIKQLIWLGVSIVAFAMQCSWFELAEKPILVALWSLHTIIVFGSCSRSWSQS